MAFNYSPKAVKDGLMLCLDATNPKSFSPNAFPNALDIYAYTGPNANNATITRDYTIDASPAGGAPLKMAITGNYPFTQSYNNASFSFANVAQGQTWIASVWIKASTNTTAYIYLFGANSSGNNVENAGTILSVTTSWTRFSSTITFNNASTVAMQINFEGVSIGGSGINIWFDGVQVERGQTATEFNYRYNQNASTWTDLSTNKNNASFYIGTPLFSTFDNKKSIRFSNINKNVYNSNHEGFLLGSNPGIISSSGTSFTFEAWFYQSTANVGQTIILSNANGGDGYRWGPNGTYSYFLLGDGSQLNEGGVNNLQTTVGRWVQMIGVFDRAGTLGGGSKFYNFINGIAQSNATIPNVNISVAAPGLAFCCGAFDGYLSILKVYNRALTTNEIVQNYNAHKSRFNI
jgi:hypothetical protein